MTVDVAIRRTIEEFPFEGYILSESTAKRAYSNIANIALRYLQPGSTILDFGCGPCDKTAVLQFLGFHCSGYDDLQDDWHKIPGNREKILSFANKCGIDFKQAKAGMLPFDKCSFDMIMLHDVLEHLHDSPRDLLNDLFELEIEWTTRIDTMWLEICPVRIGEIPQGLGTPDQYVLVTEDGEPTVRVDAYASSEESYTFRDAIKWRDFIVIGWGHGVYLIDLHSHHVSGH